MPYISKKFLNEEFAKTNFANESLQIQDSFQELTTGKIYDIFLSYSYNDKEYAIKVYKMLSRCGYETYIDLKDPELDRKDVNKQTALHIATIIEHCRCLIYLHSASSAVSKWCPWELGYMSGQGQHHFRCAIIPLTEDKEEFPRQEYLAIYPYVDYARSSSENGDFDFWVNELDGKYICLKSFVNGKDPCSHS